MLTKMSAILARTAAGWVGVVASILAILGLPNLDRLRELLARIQEILTLGGMALATTISLLFILAWVLTWLRRPKKEAHPVLPWLAFTTSLVPVGLTILAAAGEVRFGVCVDPVDHRPGQPGIQLQRLQ